MSAGYDNELYYRYIREPQERDGYTWYEVAFPSPTALAAYLRSGPPVNREVFGIDLLSEGRDERFHGAPMRTAVEYLSGGYTVKLRELLTLQKELDRTLPPAKRTVAYRKSPVGTRVHIPNALAGSPNFMLRPQRREAGRRVTIHFNASYTGGTNESKIFNRGLLTLSFIDLLERHRYGVDFRVFELSHTAREIIYIRLHMKRQGGSLDRPVTNFVVNGKEFLRRIVFRIQESMPVNDPEWGDNYGKLFYLEEMRRLLDIPPRDILIGSPHDMGIRGQNLSRDAHWFFRKIGLEEYIGIQ